MMTAEEHCQDLLAPKVICKKGDTTATATSTPSWGGGGMAGELATALQDTYSGLTRDRRQLRSLV